jgi:hypothetical protein
MDREGCCGDDREGCCGEGSDREGEGLGKRSISCLMVNMLPEN